VIRYADWGKITGKNVCCFHIAINLYVLANWRGRNWHLPASAGGCQRVFEPVLSPLLYKSITPEG